MGSKKEKNTKETEENQQIQESDQQTPAPKSDSSSDSASKKRSNLWRFIIPVLVVLYIVALVPAFFYFRTVYPKYLENLNEFYFLFFGSIGAMIAYELICRNIFFRDLENNLSGNKKAEIYSAVIVCILGITPILMAFFPEYTVIFTYFNFLQMAAVFVCAVAADFLCSLLYGFFKNICLCAVIHHAALLGGTFFYTRPALKDSTLYNFILLGIGAVLLLGSVIILCTMGPRLNGLTAELLKKQLLQKKCFQLNDSHFKPIEKMLSSSDYIDRYSLDHYTIVYRVLKAKLNDLEKEENTQYSTFPQYLQTSYLDCLSRNLSRISSDNDFIVIGAVLSGSFIGISLDDMVEKYPIFFIPLIITFILGLIYIYSQVFHKPECDFYLMIIEKLREELKQEDEAKTEKK